MKVMMMVVVVMVMIKTMSLLDVLQDNQDDEQGGKRETAGIGDEKDLKISIAMIIIIIIILFL